MTPIEKLRHSAAHVMADAVTRLFPEAKLTIGPPIESGFYYDFDVAHPFADADLAKIEELMAEIVAANHAFEEREVSRDEAIRYFTERGQPYKVELAQAIPEGERITLHSHGQFTDLCRGGHVKATGEIKAFKLLSVAGAYWRGDSRNKMLQRIYGTAFADPKALRLHLQQLEEAKKRDHRKLGKELALFTTHPWAPGAVFWLPRGTVLWNVLSNAMRDFLLGEGYVEVRTPLIFNFKLWEQSGHAAHYKKDMFLFESEEQTFGLKPMNCPAHMLIFGSELRSYRDLPLRLHDQGVLHRNEASGTLGGLTRVRQFSQDDAHIYLMPSQVGAELNQLIDMVDRVYAGFGLTYQVKISTRNPDKYMGDLAVWNEAEKTVEEAVKAKGLAYHIEPGEAAFYGPKIDFDVTDAIGRKWQCATIQLDFFQPENFQLEYVGDDNAPHRPIVIHRAIYGSFERFIALLIEHYAGSFPLWLAPVQARVVVVSEKHEAFAKEVEALLRGRGVRVDADVSNDKLGAKIRRAQLEKIPYMLVIGDKEVAARTVAPRGRDGKQHDAMEVAAFADRLLDEARPPLRPLPPQTMKQSATGPQAEDDHP